MKKMIPLITLLSFCLMFVDCKEDKKDNTTLLAGLVLLNQNKSTSASVAASYPNSVTGSSTAISGTTSATTASSSATGSATSGATNAAANILEASLQDGVSKSKSNAQTRIIFDSTTCNGVTKTATGTYTTTTTITTSSTGASSYLTAGSFTIKPNITTKVTYNCTTPTSTTTTTDYSSSGNYEYTFTGSLEITFNSATIKYFDIESFVTKGTFVYKTATLTGTIAVSNVNLVSNDKSTFTYSSSTGKGVSTYTFSGTNSDSSKSSNLVVDGAAAASFDVTTSGTYSGNFGLTGSFSGTTFTSCYNSLSFEQGGKVTGTYNGSAVGTSYNFTTADYKKFAAASGFTITMCQ